MEGAGDFFRGSGCRLSRVSIADLAVCFKLATALIMPHSLRECITSNTSQVKSYASSVICDNTGTKHPNIPPSPLQVQATPVPRNPSIGRTRPPRITAIGE